MGQESKRKKTYKRGGKINEKGMRRKKNKELLFWIRKHFGDKMLCHDLMVKNMASGIR